MTIAKDFASKLAVALVAVAMVFSAFAPATQAQTTEELQAMINDLLKQVAALQGGTGSGSSASSCVSIPAPLTMNASGANVTALQNRLIADGESIPAGATGFFGAQTRAALASWQTKNGVTPAAGYYGPITMAAMDAKCVPADTDEDDSTDEDEDDDSSMDLQGEGTLDTFEIDDASDDEIQEGAEDEVIAELTVEATDGDIEVDRMDMRLFNVDGSDDPWEVFETISVWVDGDMVAEFTADDEDEYLDEDDGTFRFTGLGLVLPEDEEMEILIGGTVMSSVDDNLPNTWTVEVNEVRYFDADGVAEDDSTTGDLGPISGSGEALVATFDIVEAGDGEELKFGLGDSNPDATDIVVDEDKKTTGVTVLEYTIEAEEGDIELNNLFVNFVITGDDYADVVDDVVLVLDGEEFDGETPVTANGSTTVEFEIDGDVTIDMDSEITAEVMVDFKSQDGNFDNGDMIQARVRAQETDATDAEGQDDVREFSGTAVGEMHTLVATGILVPVDAVEVTADTKGDNDQTGEFTIEFEVTAVEGDFYITDNVFNSTSSATNGIAYIVDLGAGTATTSGVLSSTADEDTDGVFTVEEGETETFTLTVTVDTSATTQARVTLAEINYSAETDGTTSVTAYIPTPASDFRTAFENINAN